MKEFYSNQKPNKEFEKLDALLTDFAYGYKDLYAIKSKIDQKQYNDECELEVIQTKRDIQNTLQQNCFYEIKEELCNHEDKDIKRFLKERRKNLFAKNNDKTVVL